MISMTEYLLFGGIIIGFVLLIFLIFGFSPLMRYYVRSTGTPARATILGKRSGRWVSYSGSEHNGSVTAQQVILKLEVHPDNAMPYIAEDKFMAKALDLMCLNEGCDIQVYIARNNPKRVVCLPDTVVASPDAPVQARTGVALADLAKQISRAGPTGAEQVIEALRAQGIQAAAPLAQPDTKAKLAELKGMLDSGLITQQEFEAKKKELLARM